jgi:hypothetical protein
MGNQVYANMMEVACKAASGKALCALPDVCFTPPENPATPPGVPIPYPNTGMASDCTDGSSTVSVSGQEAMLKNKSYFKRSSGDEAGCAAKKGVVTSQNMGKVYFNAWSMDVQFEGENVVRHLDLTTHNHASFPGNSPTWPYLDEMAFGGKGPCASVARKVKSACVGTKKEPKNLVVTSKGGNVKRAASMENMCKDKDCRKAMECVVAPYSPNNCCPGKDGTKPTPHHIVLKSQFKDPGEEGQAIELDSGAEYKPRKGPCICVDGTSHSEGRHGDIHSETNSLTRQAMDIDSGKRIPSDERWSVGEAESTGAEAVSSVLTSCPKGCIEEQVRAGHEAMGIESDDEIRPTTAGGEDAPEMSDVED